MTALAPVSDAIIIVDVLSFSTAVSIAIERGATVFPYRFKDESAIAYAKEKNAILAQTTRSAGTPSLSPQSLFRLQAGDRVVLPSPNGSTLALATGDTPTLLGCLRNAKAVAAKASQLGETLSIIPAGEQWSDRSLRPAIEDWIGAGAIISYLNGRKSAEAQLAEMAYLSVKDHLEAVLKSSTSGIELIERGFEKDVEIAAAQHTSICSPLLTTEGYFTNGS